MLNTDEISIDIPQIGRYHIDPGRSVVSFRTRHLFGLASASGTFAIRSGVVEVREPLSDSGIWAEIDVASFHTGNAQRDANVRSASLLDAGLHPVITFLSERVAGRAVAGALTVRGVTRPISLGIRAFAVRPASFTVRAVTRIDRTEFGVTGYRGLAGRYLDLSVSAEGVRA